MNEKDAAEKLYASLPIQKGKFNVVACSDGQQGFLLKVWITPDTLITNIPKTFNGYQVIVEQRPVFKANFLSENS